MTVSKNIFVSSSLVPVSMDASTYRVAAGEYNLYEYDGSEQFIRVERITIHPGWTGELANG